MKPTDFAEHLTAFFSTYLTSQKNVSKNTIYSYRDTFKLLPRYCQEVEHLSPEAMQLLLAQPDRNSSKGRRDQALLSVLYDTGARVQELNDLRVRDVFRCVSRYACRHSVDGKRKQDPAFSAMKNTVHVLQRYKLEQKLDSPSKNEYPMFTNN